MATRSSELRSTSALSELRVAPHKSANSPQAQQAALPESREQSGQLVGEREQQASAQLAEPHSSSQALRLSAPPERRVLKQSERPVPLAAQALPQQERAPSPVHPEIACPKIQQPLP